ncbi:VWD domain-containing protein [Lysobacter sp. H23M47]|uniref:VWD domain-containing protein n=1 Tax=Lysobacter sp. H23M47 TaxID=2781024 RepID=UPI001881463B|nr:VWD domain-containing protein [Lysobacter sp. H23M47]QOW25449.1 VWD domain-containing protein [Lysobacter sp. H23M47]
MSQRNAPASSAGQGFGALAVLLLALGTLAGCGEKGAGTSGSRGSGNVAAVSASDARMVEGPWVQDLWLYERVSTFDADGQRVELLEEILANLPGEPDAAVPLPHDAQFIAYPQLRPWLSGGDGSRRDDVTVIAGLLRTPDGDGLAIVAMPDPDAAAPIGLDDSVELDLTFLGDRLTPDDPMSIDFAFLQALPGQDPAGAGALEVLAHRMAENRIRYYGEEIDGVEEPLAFQGMLGTAVKGSTRSSTPAKADPMMKGFRDGLKGCRFGLKCVRKYFQKFGGGASKSNDLIRCNLGGNCYDPPPPPPPPRCFGRCGGVRGDPHLSTFDGANLSMQAVGEFVAVRVPRLEVQLRTAPRHSSRTVSVVTAMAMDIDGTRVLLDTDQGGLRVQIDGKAVPHGADGEVLEFATGTLTQFHRAVQIATTDGHQVIANSPSSGFIDFTMELAEGVAATGLLGNHDGDPKNDFRTRDGKVLAQPLDSEKLYKVFADGWRVADDESLFNYRDGESTATYTDRTFPEKHVTRQSLPADLLRRAEAVCRESGVALQPFLDQCIFDYAVTGEMAFVSAAQRSATIAGGTAGMTSAAPGEADRKVEPAAGHDPNAQATLKVAASAPAGSTVRVTWAGPNEPHDYIAVARPGTPGRESVNHTGTDAGNPLHLLLPAEAGKWEVRYVQYEGRKVLATQEITTTPLEASVQVSETAPAGAKVSVQWTGPNYPHDVISVVRAGAPGRESVNHTPTTAGTPLNLLMPADPGEWEVRYVQYQDHKVLARTSITTTALEAKLDIPATAPAGSTIDVSWTGPNYPYDHVSVVRAGAAGRDSVNHTPTEAGTPLKLQLPAEPGEWEVRYVQYQDHKVLARKLITTTPVTANLEVPASAAAGSKITVEWTGPGYPYDVIAVAKPGTEGRSSVEHSPTGDGTPLQVKVPDEPGTWEVRYVQYQDHTVLARKTLTVTAAEPPESGD